VTGLLVEQAVDRVLLLVLELLQLSVLALLDERETLDVRLVRAEAGELGAWR